MKRPTVPITEYFYDLREREGEAALRGVEMLEFDRPAYPAASPEGFCRDSVGFFRERFPWVADSQAVLCSIGAGRGSTVRVRKYYGLWKALAMGSFLPALLDTHEEMVDIADGDFRFVGCARVEDGLSPSAVRFLYESAWRYSFLYLPGAGRAADEERLMEALLLAYSSGRLPFYARFNLEPVFSMMGDNGAVVSLQRYDGGTAAYLFKKAFTGDRR